MSVHPALDPACSDCATENAISMIIDARPRDIGNFLVRRLLPYRQQRLVGPFIYFDHMGPAELKPGAGLNVLPHPHIGLSTVTYLFDGEIIHRDSLGSHQAIRPGDINWMTAGKFIVHSERTSADRQRVGMNLNGLQLWVALPQAHEETQPAFHHHPASTLPLFTAAGVEARVLAGSAFGQTSPVETHSPLFYLDVALSARAEFEVPSDYEERAVYLVSGAVMCGAQRCEMGRMLVFTPGTKVCLRAETAARLVLIGGAPIDGPRYIWWNFVSSSQERIERAKRDWQEGRYPHVPGDETEFVRAPDGPEKPAAIHR